MKARATILEEKRNHQSPFLELHFNSQLVAEQDPKELQIFTLVMAKELRKDELASI